MTALIELRDVVKEFRSDPPVRPLDGVSLAVQPGQLVAVTGVSGKGKSTLLNVMGGLLRCDQGTVRFKGHDMGAVRAEELDALHRGGIGFVFQTPSLFQALTARENLVLAARMAGKAKGQGAQQTMRFFHEENAVDAALALLGLADRADHLPAELSVGQRRRLVLARALLANHDVLLADEPTNDLDDAWSEAVFDLFCSFVSSGERAVVMVTHDLAYARKADRVYVLDDGVLREEAAGVAAEPVRPVGSASSGGGGAGVAAPREGGAVAVSTAGTDSADGPAGEGARVEMNGGMADER